MSRFDTARHAFTDCFRNGRLWLLQFLGNPLLIALFVAWLLIPVASNLHLIYNFIVGIVLLAAVLILHAGTLSYFSDQPSTAPAPFGPPFRRALRHLVPFALCVAVLALLWLSVNAFESYLSNFPAYLRSSLPVSLRKHLTLSALDTLFSAFIFLLRWILVPGLLLPFLLQGADRGFRGFGRQGLVAWRRTVSSLGYWLVLLLAALLGVFATAKMMALTPDFKTSTIHGEGISLAVRLTFAYVLGLFSWLLVCSMVGRCAAAARVSSDASGDPAA